MRLDPDCIRDILFDLEDKCDIRNFYSFPEDSDRLKKYDPDKVRYHLRQCNESGLISGYTMFLAGNVHIRDLSPTGHSFLADIRSDSNWEEVKTVAKKTGSESLRALIGIAANIITEIIKGQFGINQ